MNSRVEASAVDVSAQQLTEVNSDLQRSGLAISDMHVRPLASPERNAVDLGPYARGYVIPYFDIEGKPLPFYRVRVTSQNNNHRYIQPRGLPNHIYFPPIFRNALNGHSYVIITEGEKKAAAACRSGFPSVGIGGVYNWRNNLITIPKGTVLQPRTKAGINNPVPITTAHRGLVSDTTFKLGNDFDRGAFDPFTSDLASGL